MKEQVELGHEAFRLRENPILKKFLKELREYCHEAILNSDPQSPEVREDQYYMVRTIKEFEILLDEYIRTGQLAEAKPVKPRRIQPLE